MKKNNKIEPYDFSKLQRVFPNMTQYEIQREYANIYNRMQSLNEWLEKGAISEDDFFCQLEPLQEAQMFLSGYLAIVHLEEHGFSVTGQGRIVLV